MKMIILEEDTGVKSVKALHASLVEAFREEQEVTVDLSKMKRLDAATAQVLIAAGREARNTSRILKLKSVPDHIKKQLALMGVG
jgi:ABC-type transporter Mla MlaB component